MSSRGVRGSQWPSTPPLDRRVPPQVRGPARNGPVPPRDCPGGHRRGLGCRGLLPRCLGPRPWTPAQALRSGHASIVWVMRLRVPSERNEHLGLEGRIAYRLGQTTRLLEGRPLRFRKTDYVSRSALKMSTCRRLQRGGGCRECPVGQLERGQHSGIFSQGDRAPCLDSEAPPSPCPPRKSARRAPPPLRR